MSIFGPLENNIDNNPDQANELRPIIASLQQKLIAIKEEQRKRGKRYRGGCASIEDIDSQNSAFMELLSIRFLDDSFIIINDTDLVLAMLISSSNVSYRVHSRVTQNKTITHFDLNGVFESKIDNNNIDYLPLTKRGAMNINNNAFIEVWAWIDISDIGGYEFELKFYGLLEEYPKCYYYDINYLEH